MKKGLGVQEDAHKSIEQVWGLWVSVLMIFHLFI